MKNDQNELQIVNPGDTAIARPQPTYADIMQMFAQKQMTPEDVQAFKELVQLDSQMKDKEAAAKAKREFNIAFSALQKDIPRVRADKTVEKDGRVLYTYASYQEIMSQVQPLLNKHGFSVRFSQVNGEGRITYTCHLIHEGGHEAETSYTVRIGKGAPGMNETKEDAAASSVCQRECLCDALNIIRIGRDSDDPRNIGHPITEAEAGQVMARVTALKLPPTRETGFFKWAGVTVEGPGTLADYQKIMSTNLVRINEWLTKEESKTKISQS